MRKMFWLALAGLLAVPIAGAQTFTNVAVVDNACSHKVAADPDSHTRDCALKCAASGFGIITSDNQYLKFDAKGNQQIVAALKASSKSDHLRVDVSGKVEGSTIKVSSVKLL